MQRIEIISSALSIIAETPVWIKSKNELWWIDINGKRIHGISLLTKVEKCYILPQRPGCLFLDEDDGLNVACETGIYALTSTGTLLSRYPIKPQGERYNDGKVGPDGNLWVGTISPELKGVLYRIRPTGEHEVLLTNMGNSNGLDWNLAKKKFYLNDTYKHVTYVFDFDEKYQIYNQKVLREWGKENPDGMAIDENGDLYVALFGSGKIAKISGETGKTIEDILLPVPNITSVLFCGNDYKDLIVTTAAYKTDLREYPLAGSVLKIVRNEKGYPLNKIKNL